MNQLENKRILVVGMGESGIAATQALLKLGAIVSVYDRKEEREIDTQLIQFLRNKNVTCYFDKEPNNVGELDMVVISPGVPLDTGFVRKAQDAGAEVIGEIEIAYRIGKSLVSSCSPSTPLTGIGGGHVSQFTTNLGLTRLILALNWKLISGAIPFMAHGRLKLRIAKLLNALGGSEVFGESGVFDISARNLQSLPPVVTVPSRT
jgi:hypothetical protein